MLRTLATAALLAAALFLTGCIVSVKGGDRASYADHTHRTVSAPVFTELVESNKHVHLGMHRDDVLAHYPADLLTKFEAAQYDGRPLEVWQVFAYSKAKSSQFERWLYFVDDHLVEMSRAEIDYENDPTTLDRWLN